MPFWYFSLKDIVGLLIIMHVLLPSKHKTSLNRILLLGSTEAGSIDADKGTFDAFRDKLVLFY